ncbi:TonB-linked SusC/RagA family outer membrane protein [Pedobacter sp. AK017]|uniref:SusC/RagA family TonB-linked outer membrane protein n=1 Tax=Pedobacter sp. AK017 TaxID=2723073 RepID=UPI001618387F|nr:SusC/RagA family TonB-linked outer membrane protein [Pedobacter sp. AK017]MBB5437335.1 TonB-linked SusC/RagA family outer membrane protein [Pedobacter sp. AK017]
MYTFYTQKWSVPYGYLYKILLIMRLTTVILIASLMQVSASSIAQKITLSEKNASLEIILQKIRVQTGYDFLFDVQAIRQAKPIDIHVKNASLEATLNTCFEGQNFSYTINDKSVVVRQKDPTFLERLADRWAGIDVRGRIVDEQGAPLVGASVKVKGTDKMTRTNENGSFTLIGVDEKVVLEISFIGYRTIELKVAKELGVISLRLLTSDLSEVNVTYSTGYQNIPKERATGSFVQLNNDQINRVVSTDIIDRINGIASGFQLLPSLRDYSEANPINIQVRGLSTIQANSLPLIILDNFPYEGDIKSINPSDIANITILKDAAAASIWGARSGNGVIVLTSKKGRNSQPPQVNIFSNITLKDIPDLYYLPRISSSDYIDLELDLYERGYYATAIGDLNRPALSPVVETLVSRSAGQITSTEANNRINGYRSIDSRDEITDLFYNRPLIQQYSANINGGSGNQKYFFSLGFDDNMGSNKGNNYKRMSINANHTYSLIKDKLNITTRIGFVNSKSVNNAIQSQFTDYPYLQFTDANGNAMRIDRLRRGYIDTAGNGKLLDWTYKPLDELNYADNTRDALNSRLGMDIDFNVTKSVNFSVKYLYDRLATESRNYYSQQTYFARDYINQYSSINYTTGVVTRAIPLGGMLDYSNSGYDSHNIRTQMGYDNIWSKKHQLSGIIGAELRDLNAKGLRNNVYGYDKDYGSSIPVDFVNGYKNYITKANSVIPNNQSFTESNDRFVSLFANASYSYAGKYTLSASARKDGSNQFGVSTNNKYSPLWSIGSSWEISRESFYKLSRIEYLKLRATYGYQGNVDKSVAALLTTRLSVNNTWGNPTSMINNVPNEFLRWEKTGMFNVGLDFSVLNRTVSGSIEFYDKRGTDLIGLESLAPSVGQVSYKGNTANMKGNGVDVQLNSINFNKSLKWHTSLLFSYNNDKITSYKSKQTSIRNYITISGSTNPIEGNPVNSLYSYDFAGLDPANGNPLGYIKGVKSSDYVSMLNSTNFDDLKYQGRLIAPYFGSILNSFKGGDFDFSFNIIYKFGHVFRRPSLNYNNLVSGIDFGNGDYENRWKSPGDEMLTNVPSFVYPLNANRDLFYNNSSILTEKADHIRLQDIKIGYSLINHQKKIKGIKDVNISIIASNIGILWKATKYDIDPEYIPTLRNPFGPIRTYSASIKVQF